MMTKVAVNWFYSFLKGKEWQVDTVFSGQQLLCLPIDVVALRSASGEVGLGRFGASGDAKARKAPPGKC